MGFRPQLKKGGLAMIGRWLDYRSHFSLSQSGKPAAKFILPRPLTNTKLAFTSASDCFPHFDGHTLTDQGSESINNECYRLALIAQSEPSGSSAPYMFNKLISLCAKSVDYDSGSQLHSAVVKLGFCSNMYIYSSLVNLYGKCHAIVKARKLFDEMPQKNVVTWNSLISAYVQVGSPETGFELFLEMIREGVLPTPFGISSVLAGCAQLKQGWFGAQVHGLSLKCQFVSNVVVGTSLIDMYAKCSKMDECLRVFNKMPERNVMTWTTVITGHSHNNLPNAALLLYIEMRQLGLESNYVTYNSLLSSFSGRDDLDHCRQIHSQIIRVGLESNAYVQVTLVTVYSECGCSLEEFRQVCLNITQWDQISWNSVIAGFTNLDCAEEALKCFFDMRCVGLISDFFTLTSVLKSIRIISSIERGRQAHSLIFKTGHAPNVHVQNGLVSMYARCGSLKDAKLVFSSMNVHDVISWNSLLSGCAQHGYGWEVIELFEQMRQSEIQPNKSTFLSVLSACSHVGWVEKGLEIFNLLSELHSPDLEHYASVVDLCARSGHLYEAEAIINSMPIQPGPSIYKALLSASRTHGNMEISVRASKKLLELYPEESATYILLSSSLATKASWEGAADMRSLLEERTMQRRTAYSWI